MSLPSPTTVSAVPPSSNSARTRGRRPWSDWLRSPWVWSLLGLLIFLAGMVTGGGLASALHLREFRLLLTDPERIPDRMVPVVAWELSLTDEQRVAVDRAARRHFRGIAEIRRTIVPEFLQALDEFEAEVNPILDDRQRAIWHRKLSELRRVFIPGGNGQTADERRKSG